MIELNLQFFGGRGASSGSGSAINKARNEYLKNAIKNDYFLLNGDKNSAEYKAALEAKKNLPTDRLYYESLTDDEKKAIIDMQYNTSALNEYMRKNGSDNDQNNKLIADTKSAISKYKLTEDKTFYRGVGAQEFTDVYLRLDGGKTTSFKSLTTNKATAENFAKNQGGYIIEYKVSKGSRVADVNGVPGANEHEFLMDSGISYKKVERVNKQRLIVYI